MLLSTRFLAGLCTCLLISNCSTTPEHSDIPEEETAEATRASAQEIACLAEAVYFEARGTGERGTQAVAHVVVNRARSPQFPNSVCGVIADKCQFSYRCDGRSDVLAHAGDRAQATRIAQKVLSGAPDITEGALFFHAARMEPGWFNTRSRVGQFGGNIFYR